MKGAEVRVQGSDIRSPQNDDPVKSGSFSADAGFCRVDLF
jgi:hypothetical protein